MERQFYGKVILELSFKLMTGTHIGNANEGFQIGGVDKLVVRDPITQLPIIPGSSLKGKMRAISEIISVPKDRKATTGDWFNRGHKGIYRHEADTWEDAYDSPVDRVFGTTGGKTEDSSSNKNYINHPARLAVSDAHMTKETANSLNDIESSLLYTEVKSENNLDRITSAANPRQIERVPAGCVFTTRITYNVENPEHIEDDFNLIFAALQWLEDDYIGGNGSRGYGRIRFGVVPEDKKLPLDSIPSLPIAFKAKTKDVYLGKSTDEEASTADNLTDLRSKLANLKNKFKAQ